MLPLIAEQEEAGLAGRPRRLRVVCKRGKSCSREVRAARWLLKSIQASERSGVVIVENTTIFRLLPETPSRIRQTGGQCIFSVLINRPLVSGMQFE